MDKVGAARQFVSFAVLKLPSTLQAEIVASSAVINTANVPPQKRKWTQDSLLFCQLAANAKVDKQKNPIGWFKAVADNLQGIGWICADFNFTESHPTAAHSELSGKKIILEAASSVGNSRQTQTLESLLDVLAADNDSVKFLRKHSFHGSEGTFLMASCDAPGPTGELSLCLFAFNGTFGAATTNFLIEKLSIKNIQLQTASQTLSVDESIFKSIYGDIKTKLEPFVKGSIKDVY